MTDEDLSLARKRANDYASEQQRLLDANRAEIGTGMNAYDMAHLMGAGFDEDEPAENDGKADAGKVRACFPIDYFPRAIEAVARICEDGEEEYGYGTWSSVPDAMRRYREADMRHRLAIGRGEVYDPKSGKKHSWHMAWNQMAVVELECREEENK